MKNNNFEFFILGIVTNCLITAICLGKVSLIIWEAALLVIMTGYIVIKNKKKQSRRRR